MQQISVSPLSRRNSLTMLLAGGLCAIASTLMLQWQLSLMLLLPTTIAALFLLTLGVVKRLDPDVSVLVTPKGIGYHHRRGHWRLPWQQVQRIDVVRIDGIELPFVGIRLRDPLRHIRKVKPRLALALTTEQRGLQRLADPHCPDGHCAIFIQHDKQNPFNGVKGAYFNHLHILRNQLGFDLYLPHSMLDRHVSDMAQLLRRCHAQSLQPKLNP
ncbi:DUF2982 domain-containing protein [uncultured Ferrimonas sp.]|uniref:DUF2982 domain-containing protein n=1 Tax=uncultured Ferrimonas sp. TaxID=432640 RepID=UPI00263406EB|nr:DUF2982 domain-containing protein [uncultured Ferrimonas sp.]